MRFLNSALSFGISGLPRSVSHSTTSNMYSQFLAVFLRNMGSAWPPPVPMMALTFTFMVAMVLVSRMASAALDVSSRTSGLAFLIFMTTGVRSDAVLG